MEVFIIGEIDNPPESGTNGRDLFNRMNELEVFSTAQAAATAVSKVYDIWHAKCPDHLHAELNFEEDDPTKPDAQRIFSLVHRGTGESVHEWWIFRRDVKD